MNTPVYLLVHHSGGVDANPLQDSSNYTVAQCNQDHKVRFNMLSRKGFYVGYHYFIDKGGIITQTRFDDEEGAHTVGYNTSSLGICLAGNFDATLPTDAQVATLKQWLTDKSKQYNIAPSNIYPHRQFAQKTCYGKNLSDDWARNLIVKSTQISKIQKLLNDALDALKTLEH